VRRGLDADAAASAIAAAWARTVSAARVVSTFIFSAVDMMAVGNVVWRRGERLEMAPLSWQPPFAAPLPAMMRLGRLRLVLSRARELHRAAPACAAKAGAPPRDPVDGDGFAPWGGGDDAAPRERTADGAPEAQGADFEAGGKPPKSTVEKARAQHSVAALRACHCFEGAHG